MGRSKIVRSYSFKPKYKEFSPLGFDSGNKIKLNHDEIEALFLMDYQNMYQEDAAKLMNISRPTFSRIIKSARQKVTTALVTGANINLEDEMDEYIVALCYSDESFSSITPREENIIFVKIKNSQIIDSKSIKNPLIDSKYRPGALLPNYFATNDVNYFITSKVGSGLKNSLLTKGIYSIEVESIKSVEDILKVIKNFT